MAEEVTFSTAVGLNKAAGLKNLQQLIQLRWIAVAGQVFTIAAVHYGTDIAIPVDHMLAVVVGLALFNAVALFRWRAGGHVSSLELLLALLVDVATLTFQLYLSGGATNPFVFLYLMQVVLAVVLLPIWAAWALVLVTVVCFGGLVGFAQPLPIDFKLGLSSPYVLGLLVCFTLSASLMVAFIGRIMANLRERDHRLSELRQRAAEEEHVVRLGLLATGAAHELGTPLSTLAVILGDWQRQPSLQADPELAADVAEMQGQVARCKSIVSGILMSVGEARGESSQETTVRDFLNDTVAHWRQHREMAGFQFENQFYDDVPMVSDSVLQQMIGNVLDNALEASPHAVRVVAAREGASLALTVQDEGPGFAPDLLPHIGKPYQSSKGRPGGGLGLFLVFNVVRTLGGRVVVDNRRGGGAEVRITLPLAACALPGEEEADDR